MSIGVSMRWVTLSGFFVLAAIAVVIVVIGQGADRKADLGDPARGAVLYAENCASCHGANLEGQPDWRSPGEDGVLPAPPHDRTGHTWHHGDGLLFDYTKLGGAEMLKRMGVTGVNSGMPGFADSLSDQEIWDILAFIKTSWPERERELQQQRTLAEQMKGN
ncbi:cytochrome c [Ruegeria sediminis]|uniref:Cytochrome c n=1 Tax=Ruegeria sediminis TaxID=2583820 RepID=A0ABY2X5A7_9RHOB|nr:cytochrome c [Ruegeria sediminis]TMV10002.1 cytochrome c [Ruegeria sediminis]